MSEKEYKEKCESLFLKNTILINEKESLLIDNINLNRRISEMNEKFDSNCGGKCFAYQDLEAAYQMKVDEIEQLKALTTNNPYIQLLINEKAELAEDFAKQIKERDEQIECLLNNNIVKEERLNNQYKYYLSEIKRIEKENEILKTIISTILDKDDICYICQMKGKVLPECMRMENSECLKNMISLWSK